MDETSFATSVDPSSLKSGTSDSILRPNKRHSAVGGKRTVKRQLTGTTASAQRVTDHNEAVDWDDCTDTPLDQVSDFELGEYVPLDYYPNNGGQWTVEIIDLVLDQKRNEVFVKVVMVDGPIASDFGKTAWISIMHKGRGKDHTLHRALLESFPQATTPRDMYKLQANYAWVYGAWQNTQPASSQQSDTKWKPTTINKQSLAFAALTALLTMTWMAAKN
eukprot:1900850-Rhodomonas_salina.1